MTTDPTSDPRLDPRLRRLLQFVPSVQLGDVSSREELLAEANSEKAREGREAFRSIQDLCDTEEAAPTAGLTIRSTQCTSEPDGNTINLQIIRPDTH